MSKDTLLGTEELEYSVIPDAGILEYSGIYFIFSTNKSLSSASYWAAPAARQFEDGKRLFDGVSFLETSLDIA